MKCTINSLYVVYVLFVICYVRQLFSGVRTSEIVRHCFDFS